MDLLPRIVEVVEWQDYPDDSSRGHCRIAYYEQPKLLPREMKQRTDQDGDLFAECTNWLRRLDCRCAMLAALRLRSGPVSSLTRLGSNQVQTG